MKRVGASILRDLWYGDGASLFFRGLHLACCNQANLFSSTAHSKLPGKVRAQKVWAF